MSRQRVVLLTVVIIVIIIALIVYFLFFRQPEPGGGPCPSSKCGLINNNGLTLHGGYQDFDLSSIHHLWPVLRG